MFKFYQKSEPRLLDEDLEQVSRIFDPLYTGGLFHCHMLDESICHFRGVGTILSLLFFF